MNDRLRSLSRPFFVLGITLILVCCLAYFAPASSLRAVAAQSTSPSGTFGFEAGVAQIDSAGTNGGAILGLINFDGAGGVTGTAIVKPRDTNPQNAQAIPSTFTGTYSSNPDGTGTVTLNLDLGFSVTLAMVTTGGGQSIQLTGSAGCSLCSADVPLRLQGSSLSGALPIGLFLQGATGTIPLSLSGVGGGPTVYTAAAASGSGTGQCPDGSTGSWNATVLTVTVVVDGPSGNFLAGVIGDLCGQADFETVSGLVYTNLGPGGEINRVIHAVNGGVANGVARAASGGSLSGSYGVQLNFSPFPLGTVGVMTFDGAGNVNVSLKNVGGANGGINSLTFTGTYSINPDGSGTINLQNPNGQAGPTFAIVVTDGGSGFLLLRTDNNPGFDVAFGTARLQ
jgi:hypothetical protein